MNTLGAKSRIIDKGLLKPQAIKRRGELLRQGDQVARARAADVATKKSRKVFNDRLSGRPTVSPRPKRPTTQGKFADFIVWVLKGGTHVTLDIAKLDAAAPYWSVQEFGTGSKGKAYRTGPDGKRVDTAVKAPVSQVNRLIPRGLAWSGFAGSGEQIVPVGLANRMRGPGPRSSIRITKEIKSKGFARLGSKMGLNAYERELETVFRDSFSRARRSA